VVDLREGPRALTYFWIKLKLLEAKQILSFRGWALFLSEFGVALTPPPPLLTSRDLAMNLLQECIDNVLF